jgi:hypothetical protein
MDHNEFDFLADLIRPFKDFIKRIDEGISPKKQKFSNSYLRVEREKIVTIYSDID